MAPNALYGIPIIEATSKLLLALGHEVQPTRLHEQAQSDASSMDLPRLLEAHGLPGRIVQIEATDLEIMDLPTLIELKDGSWILLYQVMRNRWEVEDASGKRQIIPSWEALSGTVLDRLGILPKEKSLWMSVGRLVLDHRRPLTQILLVTAFMQVLAMASPLITRAVMDSALPQASHSLLALAVLGVLLISLASSGLCLVRDWTSAFVETRLDAIAQRGLLDHALRLPFKDLIGRTAGELMQAFTGLSIAKDLLSQRLFSTAMDAVTALGYFILMASLWPVGTGFVLGGSLLLAAFSAGSGVFQARIQRRIVPAQIIERDTMVQMLQGIATVKSAGIELRVLNRWFTRFMEVQRLGLKRQRVGLWSDVGIDSIRQLLSLVLLVEGGRRVLVGELTIGGLFAFQQMASSLTGAFQGAAGLALGFLLARPQLRVAHEIHSLEQEPIHPIRSRPMAPHLVVEDAWFRYNPEEPWVLKGFSLKVEAGSRHWLRWPSGAGKSTLLRLLAGLLEAERGQVYLGGQPAREFRDQVVYMPQGFQLYGTSILENLRILSGGAPMERIMTASETSGLSRLVATLPLGFETLLSHGGSNISGGQRQLVLLTAAMATERPVLLLDEAFANLDWLSRSEIIHGDWFQGKTVIYASHDAGLVKNN